jgi:hypothetical protein
MKLRKKRFKTKYIVFKILRIKFDIINNKIFLNFSQLLKSIFAKIKWKYFLGNQTKFFFDWKVFFINNFSNDKETQKNLKNNSQEIIFHETNEP